MRIETPLDPEGNCLGSSHRRLQRDALTVPLELDYPLSVLEAALVELQGLGVFGDRADSPLVKAVW